jgi:hypothetical protein
MLYTTYAHYKPDGSMFYIGKGSVRRAYSKAGRSIVWNRTVKKYGGFETKILAWWETEKEAFDHEIFLIQTFKEMGIKLVNIADGGKGSKGFRHSDEFKNIVKTRMTHENPMNNPETREKQLTALKIAMQRPEIKRHQSLARIGMKFSEKHIESLRNCHPTRPCVINGVEYKSLMEASRILGIRHGTLYRWLNNKHKKHIKKYEHIYECRWV